MVNPTWWPTADKIDPTTKMLIFTYQMVSSLQVLPTTIILCVNTFEAGELIIARIDHLTKSVEYVLSTEDKEEQFQRFRCWVEYHKEIIRSVFV